MSLAASTGQSSDSPKTTKLVLLVPVSTLLHECKVETLYSGTGILPEFIVACENILFSSLFAAGDVSGGGTSAAQRQKFHTDDVKSVRNPVRSTDWSME